MKLFAARLWQSLVFNETPHNIKQTKEWRRRYIKPTNCNYRRVFSVYFHFPFYSLPVDFFITFASLRFKLWSLLTSRRLPINLSSLFVYDYQIKADWTLHFISLKNEIDRESFNFILFSPLALLLSLRSSVTSPVITVYNVELTFIDSQCYHIVDCLICFVILHWLIVTNCGSRGDIFLLVFQYLRFDFRIEKYSLSTLSRLTLIHDPYFAYLCYLPSLIIDCPFYVFFEPATSGGSCVIFMLLSFRRLAEFSSFFLPKICYKFFTWI